MGTTTEIPSDLQIMQFLSDMARENADLADLKTGTYFDYASVIGNLSYAYLLISNKFYPSEIYRAKRTGCQDIRAAMEVTKILTFCARYLVEQYRGERITLAAVYAVENAKRVIDDTVQTTRIIRKFLRMFP